MPRDRVEDDQGLRQHGAAGVDHRHRLDRDARGPELALQLHPDGDRRAWRKLRLLAALVHRVDGREPDGPGAFAGGDLHCDRVHPADRAVQGDRAHHMDAGDGRAHDRGALRRRRVVRLELEAGEAELGEPACEREVVDAAPDDVRRDVHVHVVRASEQRTRTRETEVDVSALVTADIG